MNKKVTKNLDLIWGQDHSLASFSSHSYLLRGDKKILIDPGSFAHQKEMAELSPDLIVATHEHWDHIAAADFFENITKLAHPEALSAVNQPDPNVVRPTGQGDEHKSKFEAIPDIIDLGDLKLEVIWTPGHTRGGICLYEPTAKILFAGDTVFADGGVGRIFHTGNRDDYTESLEKLMILAKERGIALICPGHGDLVEGEEACLDSLRASYHNLSF